MIKLVFGCGYLGERVARRWRSAGHDIVVVTRSAGRAEGFLRDGYRAIVADVTRPETLADLPAAETVLFSVGYDRASGPSIEDVYAGGVRNVLAALPAETGRFIYISTTGVYGSSDGGWVDEQTPPDPQREGGRVSLAAERALSQHRLASRAIILRLAGIYGPARLPFLKELQSGQAIPAPTTGWLNLIHVDDAAAIVVAAAELPCDPQAGTGPRIYCVSDGQPVERIKFYSELARQIGAPLPRFVEPAANSPRAARARANRRVRNDHMLADLDIRLTYPNFRAALAALLETQNQQQPR